MKNYLVTILLFFTFWANAQVDADLIEINFRNSSNPQNFTAANNRVYFTAKIDDTDSTIPCTLYYYDNLTSEIKQVKHLNVSVIEDTFTMVNNILFFLDVADRLWRSDGTESGTYFVNPSPDTYFIHFSSPISYNGKLYFISKTETEGTELWVSNGTPQGTYLLKDIAPGPYSSAPGLFTVYNNNLYFTASTPSAGRELWVSNGTPEGTSMVKDIYPGTLPSNISEMVVLSGYLYFFASDGITGHELWRSDGTATGTSVFKEIHSGSSGVINATITAVTPTYFTIDLQRMTGSRQIWRCDGTTAGTFSIKNIASEDGTFKQFATIGNTVYMASGDFFSDKQLWKTDGTAAGTQQIINYSQSNGNIHHLTAAQNYLIFGNGREVYVSYGSADTTAQLADVNLGDSTGSPTFFCAIENKFLFLGGKPKHGYEPWITDGTTAGTKMIKDLNHFHSSVYPYGHHATTVFNNKLVFVANNGINGHEPFTSDGTVDGTHILKDISPESSGISYGYGGDSMPTTVYVTLNNKLIFKGYNPTLGHELYVTDGTSGGTQLIKDIAPNSASSLHTIDNLFMIMNNILYFKADNQVNGYELWRTDGTNEGTYMLKDINPGAASGLTRVNQYAALQQQYAVLNNTLYFTANDGTGEAIWKTDGTAAGTIKVITYSGEATIIGANDSKVFFVTPHHQPTGGTSNLWVTNGTQSGTTLIKSYNNSSGTNFKKYCILNNEIYFNVYVIGMGECLVKSDGTSAGTIPLINFEDNGSIAFVESCGDYVYAGTDPLSFEDTYFYKLYRSDGTPEGSISLINQSSGPGIIRDYSCFEDNFYYSRTTFNQTYIYVAQNSGINSHTLVNLGQDITTSSQIMGILGFANGKIFLNGYTRQAGQELYTITLTDLFYRLGIDEKYVEKVNMSIVYPNPAENVVNVQASQAISKLCLYTITGQKLIEKDNVSSIDISGIQPGMYIFTIKTENGVTETKKIVKK